MKTLDELKARLVALNETAVSLQNKADTEGRELSDDESGQIEAALEEFDRVEADIKRREKLANQGERVTSSAGRRAPPQASSASGATSLQASSIRASRDPALANAWGWKSFGEFAHAVRGAITGRSVDARLENAALSTYGSEGVGADGGFAVPPEYRANIMQKVMGDESLLSRCDNIPTSAYSVTFPKDETTPWGTAGIQAYWDGEAATLTQKKPALQTSTIKAHKLTALVPVTDELLEDAPALGSYVASKAADVIDFKVTDAIINGTGAGQPLGILDAACTVQQGKEASQVAATIHGLNLIKMWARMPARWRSAAVWLIHPDAEPQLMGAGLQIGPAAAGAATGGQLVWMPPGGVSGSPYATLLGRPVIPSQACQALGTAGDIIFASMPQYATVQKSGGVKSDSSIHLWFDQGITAFRFSFRLGGQPWWSSTIAAKNGSGTYGPFVKLETRA